MGPLGDSDAENWGLNQGWQKLWFKIKKKKKKNF